MAYNLHIERVYGRSIALSEWHSAVEATEGVRLSAADAHIITNPSTREIISISSRDGDAEVLFPDGQWHSVLRWRGTSAVFAARFDPGKASDPTWRAAVALATRLGAVICGDDGEAYDFETGETPDV